MSRWRRFGWLVIVAASCEPAPPPADTRTFAQALLGPCGIEVSKVKYNEFGVDDGALEAVELTMRAAPPGATLGSCGVTTVGAWHQGTSAICSAPDVAHAVDVSALVIPDSGVVLLGRGDSAITPPPDGMTPSTTSSWLPNGPDFVALAEGDVVVYALAIPKGGIYPTCALPGFSGAAVDLPDDPETHEEDVEIACGDSFLVVPLASSPFRAPNMCPAVAMDAGTPDAPPPSCHVRFSKLDIVEPRVAGTPLDAHQAVELYVVGTVSAGTTTLGDCGVRTLSPFDPDAVDGSCALTAAFYNELDVHALVVPASGRLVIGNRSGATLAWPTEAGSTFAVLLEGPGSLSLRDAQGTVVEALSYPSPRAPAVYGSCASLGTAALVPADVNTEEPAPRDQVLVRCDDDTWSLALDDDVAWGAAASCGASFVSDAGALADQAGTDAATAQGEIPPASWSSTEGASSSGTSSSGSSEGCALGPVSARPSCAALTAWCSLLLAALGARRRSRAPTPRG